MTLQFMRAIKLDVGPAGKGVRIPGTSSLRVEFQISRDEKPWPNTATVRIYNLNPDHRAELAAMQGVPCRLEAGYKDGTGVLFDGMLRDAVSIHNGVNWVTTLEAGDGELDKDGDPISGTQIKQTWSKGTPLIVVLQAFVKALKLKDGNLATASAAHLSTGVALPFAMAVDGPALEEFIYLMRALKLPWSVQNGVLQVRLDPKLPASTGPLISPQTGLVDSVEVKTERVNRFGVNTWIKVCEGKCLLLPELLPGQMFVLNSKSVTGTALCRKVTHTGDTHGNDWYTGFEGIYG